jgi:succinate dehydrogenase / fumarate reductase cytochrome b subunit
MPSVNRPLSPHLQVYRWQLTSVLSILHRMTGVFLSLGAVALVWWLFAAAQTDTEYAPVQAAASSLVGKLFLLAWTFSLFYHLANGIRHLLWDAGFGFDLKTTYLTGWTVVACAFLLTAFAWACPVLRP